MQETWGERVTRIIIDEEMNRAGVIYIDGLTDRLAAYLDAPERERYLADASELASQSVTNLYNAFFEFISGIARCPSARRGF